MRTGASVDEEIVWALATSSDCSRSGERESLKWDMVELTRNKTPEL